MSTQTSNFVQPQIPSSIGNITSLSKTQGGSTKKSKSIKQNPLSNLVVMPNNNSRMDRNTLNQTQTGQHNLNESLLQGTQIKLANQSTGQILSINDIINLNQVNYNSMQIPEKRGPKPTTIRQQDDRKSVA